MPAQRAHASGTRDNSRRTTVNFDDTAKAAIAAALERYVAERSDLAAHCERISADVIDYRREWQALADLEIGRAHV